MKLKYIQFAKDYKFREAWVIDYPDNPLAKDEVTNFLNGSPFKSLSFEAFFDINSVFLIVGYSCPNNQFQAFIEESLRFAVDHKQVKEFISQNKKRLPSLIRVGILDHWFDTGLVVLYDHKNIELPETFTQLKKRFSDNKRLMSTTLAPQGLSFYYKHTEVLPEMWIMYDVSMRQQGKYELDFNKVADLLHSRPG